MHEMTASDMLRDPLIRQMLRADKISLAAFAILLDAAARKHAHHSANNGFAGRKTADTWTIDALSSH